jgi:hypothetical protein
MKGKLTKLPRAEQWADRIRTQLGRNVEAIIEVGRLLVKAKADLPHGEWGRLFDDDLLPFSQQTASKWMAIAEHPLISNPAHVRSLPPAWSTLYELTKAEPSKVKNALKDGIITPDMPRKAVAALLPPKKKKIRALVVLDQIPRSTDDDDAIAIRDALRPVRDLIQAWPEGRSLRLVVHEVRQLLMFLERVEAQPRDQVSA